MLKKIIYNNNQFLIIIIIVEFNNYLFLGKNMDIKIFESNLSQLSKLDPETPTMISIDNASGQMKTTAFTGYFAGLKMWFYSKILPCLTPGKNYVTIFHASDKVNRATLVLQLQKDFGQISKSFEEQDLLNLQKNLITKKKISKLDSYSEKIKKSSAITKKFISTFQEKLNPPQKKGLVDDSNTEKLLGSVDIQGLAREWGSLKHKEEKELSTLENEIVMLEKDRMFRESFMKNIDSIVCKPSTLDILSPFNALVDGLQLAEEFGEQLKTASEHSEISTTLKKELEQEVQKKIEPLKSEVATALSLQKKAITMDVDRAMNLLSNYPNLAGCIEKIKELNEEYAGQLDKELNDMVTTSCRTLQPYAKTDGNLNDLLRFWHQLKQIPNPPQAVENLKGLFKKNVESLIDQTKIKIETGEDAISQNNKKLTSLQLQRQYENRLHLKIGKESLEQFAAQKMGASVLTDEQDYIFITDLLRAFLTHKQSTGDDSSTKKSVIDILNKKSDFFSENEFEKNPNSIASKLFSILNTLKTPIEYIQKREEVQSYLNMTQGKESILAKNKKDIETSFKRLFPEPKKPLADYLASGEGIRELQEKVNKQLNKITEQNKENAIQLKQIKEKISSAAPEAGTLSKFVSTIKDKMMPSEAANELVIKQGELLQKEVELQEKETGLQQFSDLINELLENRAFPTPEQTSSFKYAMQQLEGWVSILAGVEKGVEALDHLAKANEIDQSIAQTKKEIQELQNTKKEKEDLLKQMIFPPTQAKQQTLAEALKGTGAVSREEHHTSGEE